MLITTIKLGGENYGKNDDANVRGVRLRTYFHERI